MAVVRSITFPLTGRAPVPVRWKPVSGRPELMMGGGRIIERDGLSGRLARFSVIKIPLKCGIDVRMTCKHALC